MLWDQIKFKLIRDITVKSDLKEARRCRFGEMSNDVNPFPTVWRNDRTDGDDGTVCTFVVVVVSAHLFLIRLLIYSGLVC